MEKSKCILLKQKNPDTQVHILYDSFSLTYWKKQSFRDRSVVAKDWGCLTKGTMGENCGLVRPVSIVTVS